MLNKDLYERYLQKKAKKLGISVEELKGEAPKNQPDVADTKAETAPSGFGNAPSQPQVASSNFSQQQQNVSENDYVQRSVFATSQDTQTSYSETSYNQPLYNQSSYLQPTYSQPEPPKPVEPVDRRENKFCVIGYPLGHSLSSVIHKAGFKSLGIDASYETLETPPEDLVTRIKFLKNNNFKGFNVTIPLKLPVALFVDEVDKYADIASAINTVIINPDRTMKGYNTDVIGFKNAIPKDFNLTGKVAGILGTGGAAHAASVALADSNVKEIRFYTRSIPNSLELLNYMRRVFPKVKFEAYQIEYIRDLSMVDVLVNTTPIGMLGRSADMTPVEKPQLATLPEHALVYDVIYNPKNTIFLKLAQELGYKTVNGVDMFIGQAAAAEEIWTGRVPNMDAMKIALLEAL